MIPLAVPNLSGREADYLQECVATNYVSTVGPFVPRLEKLTAELTGFPYAVATNTGTSALHVALSALGVKRDDLVVEPSYTFVATANAVRMCGADPWLFDIEDESWGIDPSVLAGEFERVTVKRAGALWHRYLGRRVSAIVAVCSVGQPPKLSEIGDVAARAGVPLVVDAAGAAGVGYLGRRLGDSVQHSVLSLNGNKTFTAGGGGVFLTHDANLSERVRHLSSTARTGGDYSHDMAGFNYRLTNIQAAVGCAQLEQADVFLSRKREIDTAYRDAWQGTDLNPFPRTQWADSTCWMTGALLAAGGSWRVADLVNHLATQGIQARGFWKPMHLQLPYADCPRSEMSVTEDLWPRVLTLPSSTSLSVEDQGRVISSVLALVASA